mmetsp:Transcript_44752/g.71514  ORF Transcript_44752/g.71514 Transcript_44752/m.71514 type:complete len:315 (+) Transcript_44752:858-1802(+)
MRLKRVLNNLTLVKTFESKRFPCFFVLDNLNFSKSTLAKDDLSILSFAFLRWELSLQIFKLDLFMVLVFAIWWRGLLGFFFFHYSSPCSKLLKRTQCYYEIVSTHCQASRFHFCCNSSSTCFLCQKGLVTKIVPGCSLTDYPFTLLTVFNLSFNNNVKVIANFSFPDDHLVHVKFFFINCICKSGKLLFGKLLKIRYFSQIHLKLILAQHLVMQMDSPKVLTVDRPQSRIDICFYGSSTWLIIHQRKFSKAITRPKLAKRVRWTIWGASNTNIKLPGLNDKKSIPVIALMSSFLPCRQLDFEKRINAFHFFFVP